MSRSRWLTILILAAAIVGILAYAPASARAFPQNDHGCYCHHSGIGMWVNGTDIGIVNLANVNAGATFHLQIRSVDVAATGVVPGVQVWLSNLTDNSKFQFSPTQITDNSAQDLNSTTGTITAVYAITAPLTNGRYDIEITAQGVVFDISIGVQGGTSATGTTTTQSTSPPATPVSLYSLVQQYGPYLPLAAIILAAIHFVRRKGWTGKSPW